MKVVVVWCVLIDKKKKEQVDKQLFRQYYTVRISDMNKLVQLSLYDNVTDVIVIKTV